MMESDDVLRNSEKFYEMTREEQLSAMLHKARRVYDINKHKYYTNYQNGYFHWFYMMFKGGLVSNHIYK